MVSLKDPHRLFSGLILAVLGYEWLVSGLDKILNGGFVAGLQQQLSDAVSNIHYAFYVRIVNNLFIPHSELMGYSVEIAELTLGVVFFVLAVYTFLGKMSRNLYRTGIALGIIAAFASLNLFFYQGGAFFVSLSNPYNEGISIGFILVLANLAVAVWSLMSLRQKPKLHLVRPLHPRAHRYGAASK
ncbi:hypothetical protein [Alicyclobacillus ferrooxydans]|uniref:Uncharacterized protein n=1 Tax=Alicyclobacillus ferrooxydans TaxID=471514 RepID=A0A0N8PP95_9BACL|nr:hypothetical protein [Alicyclobacillus ferrooxydans]KPV43701.1 hypothetical protein AN477_11105 [Alicyclobacillus ferrooxydans]